MLVKGYEIKGEWKASNIGNTVLATKGTKKYFLKRYGEYKYPRHDASMSDALYARLSKEFNDFKANRIAINEALSSLAGPGGNIILPTDWFVDDIYYIEATEFVENLIEDEDILKLSKEDKLFVMMTATGAVHNIHRKNIVHSDLKRTNILAAKNSAGKIVAKIIDFDRSYFANNIRPDELGGDQNFMSPELAQCFMYDMDEEALGYLSTKSDIFSLGLVFHDYLTSGDHPKLENLTGALKNRFDEGKTVYCSEALLAGGNIIISKKIKDKYLTHLLAAMLQPEPEDRPTAQEVLDVLKTKKVLDVKPHSQVKIDGEEAVTESVVETSFTTTAPAHEEEKVPEGFCEPWDDHKIVFDEGKLTSGGYVACARIEHKGIKCYQLVKKDGKKVTFNCDNLVLLGLATRVGAPSKKKEEEKPAPIAPSAEVIDDGTLWESDKGYEFNMSVVSRMGYTKISKAQKNGKNGYILTKASGEQRFMSFDNLRMLSFVTKK